MERKLEDILQGVFAEMRREKSSRQLVLHAEPDRTSHPRLSGGRLMAIAASGVAAAIVAGVFMLTAPTRSQSDGLVCYVNGARIVDRELAIEYTKEALGIAGAGLERSSRSVSATMELVGDILGRSQNRGETEE